MSFITPDPDTEQSLAFISSQRPSSLLSYRPFITSSKSHHKSESSFLAQLINPIESDCTKTTTTTTTPITTILKQSSTDSTCSLSPTTTTTTSDHSNPAVPTISRDRSETVYTPDSLESFIQSSNSSSYSNLKDFEDVVADHNQIQTLIQCTAQADLEADLEIELINNETPLTLKDTDSSLIMEKIKKINQLQEKIDDISDKIKQIDMSGDESPTLRYYINPKYCEDDEEIEMDDSENDELDNSCLSERFRSMNNQTAFGMVKSGQKMDFVDDEDEENEDEFYEEDEEDDEDDDLIYGYKQAQPVGKKYASTGFLCHRFGGYLAPIEESQDETPIQSAASCYNLLVRRESKERLNYSRTSFLEEMGVEDEEVGILIKEDDLGFKGCVKMRLESLGMNEPVSFCWNETSLGDLSSYFLCSKR